MQNCVLFVSAGMFGGYEADIIAEGVRVAACDDDTLDGAVNAAIAIAGRKGLRPTAVVRLGQR